MYIDLIELNKEIKNEKLIKIDGPIFGPAGSSPIIRLNCNNSVDIPRFLSKIGLNAFEYQCGHGVRISEDTASLIGEQAKLYGISLSIHAPYFISIGSSESRKIEISINNIVQTSVIADKMGADKVIFHPGTSRNEDLVTNVIKKAKLTIKTILNILDDKGINIKLCPETAGKCSQIGNLEEILELCQLSDRVLPAIDFAHLQATGAQDFNCQEAYNNIFDKVERALGENYVKSLHIHFSLVEPIIKNGIFIGERRHRNFEDIVKYGINLKPEFNHLAAVIKKRGLSPTIICESAGMQAEDALEMLNIYNKLLYNNS